MEEKRVSSLDGTFYDVFFVSGRPADVLLPTSSDESGRTYTRARPLFFFFLYVFFGIIPASNLSGKLCSVCFPPRPGLRVAVTGIHSEPVCHQTNITVGATRLVARNPRQGCRIYMRIKQRFYSEKYRDRKLRREVELVAGSGTLLGSPSYQLSTFVHGQPSICSLWLEIKFDVSVSFFFALLPFMIFFFLFSGEEMVFVGYLQVCTLPNPASLSPLPMFTFCLDEAR